MSGCGAAFRPRRALARPCLLVFPLLAHAQLYRLDDQLPSAKVSAHKTPTSIELAEPVLWDFNDQKIAWRPQRGRMGFRTGELVVQGEGSSPVILSPREPAIDWSRYQSVQIRMMAEGGSQVQIKIGDLELVQPLGPARQYQVYRFDLNLAAPTYGRPLAVMATDSPRDLAAIDFIELSPKKIVFANPAGRQTVAKRDEYRAALYAHAPSSIAYEAAVPPNGALHFAIGVVEKQKPLRFRVLAGRLSREVYSRQLDDPDVWVDAEVDLAEHRGQRVRLALETQGAPGTVGLWANPLITTRAAKNRPNVLLYMIDTLRADHTSLYGYARDTTPFLKKLGAAGVVFDDCHAPAAWTKPSVASLLTSLHSYTHGIFQDTQTIPDGATTMAEQLRAAGYVTASIVANPWAGITTGLERGFDYLLEYPVVQRLRGDEAVHAGTDSAALNAAIFPWLDRHRDEPFFLYAHSTDPHAPYRPPALFEAIFAKPAETAAFNRDYDRMRQLRQDGGGAVFSRAEAAARGVDADLYIRRGFERYDGEIAHNDRQIELLVSKLRELGILDNTLILVVSDHGEEFLEHGWTAHGHSLYEELTRAVWLMWNPKLLPAARRVKEPVQLVDLMPTLLDLLGIPVTGLVQGQSVAALARGQPFRRVGPVMTSRVPLSGNRTPAMLVPENRTRTFAWLDASWKLIYRDQGQRVGLNRVELYDRRQDRADAANVAAQHPQVVERLMGEVTRWIEGQKEVSLLLGQPKQAPMNAETVKRLRSLGYLGGK